MSEASEQPLLPPPRVNPVAAGVVFGGLGALVVGGALAVAFLRNREPPPAEIAGRPQLVAGRAVFLDRCVSCHGVKGRGNGPIAKALKGPPPGDLTDRTWKHGDRPEQVELVISRGVPGTSMPGWKGTLGPDDLRAVTAYVYYLAGREVPASLAEGRRVQ